MLNNPLIQLEQWLKEEKLNGNIFPQGAVLSTVTKEVAPRSRVVSTMLNENKHPKFHTSPISRKVKDIEFNNKASLTYSFQSTLRSISIEGTLSPLSDFELEQDWLKYDDDFREHYVVFGENSGENIPTLDLLREKRDQLTTEIELVRPNSFIGYKFSNIDRISFYSVVKGDFAKSTLYKKDSKNQDWLRSIVVP